jgi:cyclase
MMNAACVLIAALWAITGTPQSPPQFDAALQTTRLGEQLYLIEGAGGNVLVFVWEDGVLLVDDKIAPASAPLKAAVAAITPKPVRFVLNSHWHPDHRGGNAMLARDGAVIVAHENVRRRMSVEGFIAVFDRKFPAQPAEALPIVTFTRDVKFHLGGEEISVIHVDGAHTDGDAFVRFHKANVMHMGDCYLKHSFPVIDYTNGGSYVGTIAAANLAIELADERTRIVPGHGAVSDERELGAWRDMLVAILVRVRSAVKLGKSLQEVKAERPTRDWNDKVPQSFVTPDHPIEEAYRDVAAGKTCAGCPGE